jgi:ankyrin repeat protein
MSQTRITTSAKDEEGHTPLMRAALDGQTGIVKDLLRKGADPNARDREGHTAIMFAVINLHAATVQTLLQFGADVNVQADCGCTPLMLAACSGDAGIARALLNKGADARKICRPGKTALDVAEEHGYTAIVELLKKAMGRSIDGEPQNVPTDTRRRQDYADDERVAGFLQHPHGELTMKSSVPKGS